MLVFFWSPTNFPITAVFIYPQLRRFCCLSSSCHHHSHQSGSVGLFTATPAGTWKTKISRTCLLLSHDWMVHAHGPTSETSPIISRHRRFLRTETKNFVQQTPNVISVKQFGDKHENDHEIVISQVVKWRLLNFEKHEGRGPIQRCKGFPAVSLQDQHLFPSIDGVRNRIYYQKTKK